VRLGSPSHTWHVLGDELVTVRPARPEDAGRIGAYVRGLSFASRYTRFLGPVSELAPADLHRMTHDNDAAPPALIVESGDGDARTVIGEARYAFDGIACEFALSVSDSWRGKGVGTLLMGIIGQRAKLRGAHYLVGDVLRSNKPMLALAHKLGFAVTRHAQSISCRTAPCCRRHAPCKLRTGRRRSRISYRSAFRTSRNAHKRGVSPSTSTVC
jgi:acetyltransferase